MGDGTTNTALKQAQKEGGRVSVAWLGTPAHHRERGKCSSQFGNQPSPVPLLQPSQWFPE